MSHSKTANCKIGLFSIGLAAYWPQFSGLRERLAGYGTFVGENLTAMGATVVDVEIPNLDAEYRAARGSAPGSLKAGWTAYLSRGAKPDDKVITLEDLLASGKLAPV